MEKFLYELGTIELNDSVYVSDPCYEAGTWCQALMKGLKPGKYHGFMYKVDTGFGRCVTDLWIVHEDNIKGFPKKLVKDVEIGVDSGAAGIFDKDYYENYHTLNENGQFNEEHDEWYNKQFDLRYYFDKDGNKLQAEYCPDSRRFEITGERADGISLDNKCVVSFSGYGDGGYNLYEAKNTKGQIVGLRIKFI